MSTLEVNHDRLLSVYSEPLRLTRCSYCFWYRQADLIGLNSNLLNSKWPNVSTLGFRTSPCHIGVIYATLLWLSLCLSCSADQKVYHLSIVFEACITAYGTGMWGNCAPQKGNVTSAVATICRKQSLFQNHNPHQWWSLARCTRGLKCFDMIPLFVSKVRRLPQLWRKPSVWALPFLINAPAASVSPLPSVAFSTTPFLCHLVYDVAKQFSNLNVKKLLAQIAFLTACLHAFGTLPIVLFSEQAFLFAILYHQPHAASWGSALSVLWCGV